MVRRVDLPNLTKQCLQNVLWFPRGTCHSIYNWNWHLKHSPQCLSPPTSPFLSHHNHHTQKGRYVLSLPHTTSSPLSRGSHAGKTPDWPSFAHKTLTYRETLLSRLASYGELFAHTKLPVMCAPHSSTWGRLKLSISEVAYGR